MIFRFVICTFFLVGASMAIAQEPSSLQLRLIAIDYSSSMAYKDDPSSPRTPIEDVKRDLIQLLNDQPPSRREPIGFILFAGTNKPVTWFRDKAKAIAFVESIVADQGGTSIATGLREAKKQILKYGKKANVSLVLYTDDEDMTPDETTEVVEELSALFSDRKEHNLEQEVVVRSWSEAGVGSHIQTILKDNPDVAVVHTSEPVYANNKIETKTSAPPIPRHFEVQVTINPTGKVQWKDKQSNVARYEFEVTAETTEPKPGNGPPIDFLLRATDACACKLVGGLPPIRCQGPGTSRGTIELDVPLRTDEIVTASVRHRPDVDFVIEQIPTNVSFLATKLRAYSSQLPPPPAVETTIAMTTTQVSEGSWYALPDIACYHIQTELTVNGPFPEGTKLILDPPKGIYRLKLNPDTLREGSQRIDLLVAAAVEPTSTGNEFAIALTPPDDTDLIRFIPPDPLTLELEGPPPVRLTPARRAYRGGSFRSAAYDTDTNVSVPCLLELDGPVTAPFVNKLKLSVSAANANRSVGAVKPYEGFSLPYSLSLPESQPYFVDHVEQSSVEVQPVVSTPVVQSETFQVRITKYAPFKRHLVVSLTALCVIGTPLCVWKLIRSLRMPAEEAAYE